MECLRPHQNDLSLRPVIKPFESAKKLHLRLDNNVIQICSRKGTALESIPLDQVKWYPCALPEGRDHCLALQYKELQQKEIYLKASSRKAVAYLASQLDAAARLSTKSKKTSSSVMLHAHTTSTSLSTPTPSSDTTKCMQCDELIEECKTLVSSLSIVEHELIQSKRELQDARAEVSQHKATETALLEHNTQHKQRMSNLEECLREAADRCENLMKELQMALTAADSKENKCKELESKIVVIEEEKKYLVDALTTAQAQLYDAQAAFKDTAAQLAGASKSCSNAKSQAAAARADLDVVKEEASKYELAALKAQQELLEMQEQVKMTKQQLVNNEKAWASERGKLEGTITALKNVTSDVSSSSEDMTQEELSLLRKQILLLKEHLMQSHDAEAYAQRAQREVDTAQRELLEYKNLAKEQVEMLKLRVNAAENDARCAKEESRAMQEKLVGALAGQAAAIKDRNELETALDAMKIELDRAKRENDFEKQSNC